MFRLDTVPLDMKIKIIVLMKKILLSGEVNISVVNENLRICNVEGMWTQISCESDCNDAEVLLLNRKI